MTNLISLILALSFALTLAPAPAPTLPEGMRIVHNNEHVWGSMPLADGGFLITGYLEDAPTARRFSSRQSATVPIYATAYDAAGSPLWTNWQLKPGGLHLLHALGTLPDGNLFMASNIMQQPDMYPFAIDPATGETQPLPDNFPDYNDYYGLYPTPSGTLGISPAPRYGVNNRIIHQTLLYPPTYTWFDADFNTVWSREIPELSFAYVHKIIPTPDGLLGCGVFINDLDPTRPDRALAFKLSPDGSLLWLYTAPDSGSAIFYDMLLTPDGRDILAVGYTGADLSGNASMARIAAADGVPAYDATIGFPLYSPYAHRIVPLSSGYAITWNADRSNTPRLLHVTADAQPLGLLDLTQDGLDYFGLLRLEPSSDGRAFLAGNVYIDGRTPGLVSYLLPITVDSFTPVPQPPTK